MLKKATAVLMCLIMTIACFGSTVYATGDDYGISIASAYALSASSELNITGTTAKCVSKATGITSVTSIVVNQTLEKKTSSGSWQLVVHWNETDSGKYASTTNYKYSLASGTYRLKSQFTFLTSAGFETITAYSGERTV
ncbi:MAG: hypothetical protein E7500_02805 [Ruminococcus sp.]|nr:hypothetical protein [Ruminococcus sp.]